MPFCSNCGQEYDHHDASCKNCGVGIAQEPFPSGENSSGETRELSYHISPRRVILMTILSYGLYLFYWFYLTWKEYRDHTGAEAYPVWHALTLLVPIYGLFRTHAHMRSLRKLMVQANISCSIRPGLAVLVIIVSSVLESISAQIAVGFGSTTITQGVATLSAVLDITAITMILGLLLQVQKNLNGYWESLTDTRVASERIGWGEPVLGIIGAFTWMNTLASIFSESWRMTL